MPTESNLPEARRQPRIVGVGVRRASAREWADSTLVMLQGEVGRDTTNNLVKFGDGAHVWAELPIAATAVQPTTGTPVDEDWPDLTVLAEAAMLSADQ